MAKSIVLLTLILGISAQSSYAKVVPGQYLVPSSGIIHMYYFQDQLVAQLLEWGPNKVTSSHYEVEINPNFLKIYSAPNAPKLGHIPIGSYCPIVLTPVDHSLDSEKETTKYRYQYGEGSQELERRYATKINGKI